MIQNNGITSKEANDKLGVTRLSQYIYLLRKDSRYIVIEEKKQESPDMVILVGGKDLD